MRSRVYVRSISAGSLVAVRAAQYGDRFVHAKRAHIIMSEVMETFLYGGVTCNA